MCQLFVRHPVETHLVASNGWLYRYKARANFHRMNLSDDAASSDTMAAEELQMNVVIRHSKTVTGL